MGIHRLEVVDSAVVDGPYVYVAAEVADYSQASDFGVTALPRACSQGKTIGSKAASTARLDDQPCAGQVVAKGTAANSWPGVNAGLTDIVLAQLVASTGQVQQLRRTGMTDKRETVTSLAAHALTGAVFVAGQYYATAVQGTEASGAGPPPSRGEAGGLPDVSGLSLDRHGPAPASAAASPSMAVAPKQQQQQRAPGMFKPAPPGLPPGDLAARGGGERVEEVRQIFFTASHRIRVGRGHHGHREEPAQHAQQRVRRAARAQGVQPPGVPAQHGGRRRHQFLREIQGRRARRHRAQARVAQQGVGKHHILGWVLRAAPPVPLRVRRQALPLDRWPGSSIHESGRGFRRKRKRKT